MYPNDYCNQCDPAPTPVVTPPPVCDGNPCAEVMNTQCINYDGLTIDCFGITQDAIDAGFNMNEMVALLGQIFCSCQNPLTSVVIACDSFTITVTNPITSVDLFEVQYSTDEINWIPVTTVPGQTEILIDGLDELTTYYFQIRKVCLPSGGPAIPAGVYSDWIDNEIETIECGD